MLAAMKKKLPKRPPAHVRGDAAVLEFQRLLPDSWIWRPEETRDYGVDGRVEIVDGDRLTGLVFAVQVKGRRKGLLEKKRPGVKLMVSTLNYFEARPEPVLVVAVVPEVSDGLWLWHHKIQRRWSQEQASVKVRFPAGQRLQSMDWGAVAAEVGSFLDRSVRSSLSRVWQALPSGSQLRLQAEEEERRLDFQMEVSGPEEVMNLSFRQTP